MKPTILLTLVFLNLSCLGPIQPLDEAYTFKKNSDYMIEVPVYTGTELSDSFQVESMATLERARAPSSGLKLLPSKAASADSITITFNKERRIIQYCDGQSLVTSDCAIEKNLASLENLISREVRKKVNGSKVRKEYQYIFDNSDYERAVIL